MPHIYPREDIHGVLMSVDIMQADMINFACETIEREQAKGCPIIVDVLKEKLEAYARGSRATLQSIGAAFGVNSVNMVEDRRQKTFIIDRSIKEDEVYLGG